MPTSFLAGIFGRSPVQPLKDHMAKAAEAGHVLLDFIEAALAGDWERAANVRSRLQDIEHEADRLKADLRIRLPSTLMMPVDRGDLLDLITTQDRIANRAKDIAGLMYGRRMVLPDSLAPGYRRLAQRSVDAVDQAERSVGELDELFTAGFRGAEVKLVERMITELDAIEDDTDTLASELRAQVFAMEQSLPPVDVIFLYKAIEWLGDLGDFSHRVGGLLQRLIAR
ncbi:MAG: TIGR00153 family protein [Xanthomonadales bacterium]|nr:TIGR00153 family protein [Xanthomonadales bacterium]